MRKIIFSFVFLSLGLVACKNNREPNKIIDGLPFRVEETVIPAYAIQELMLLTRDNIRQTITILNKTSVINNTYSEVVNVSSNTYQFHVSNSHYGDATITIQFFDATGVALDPIATQTSSATIKSVTIAATGSSQLFTYTETSALTLDIAGDISSTIRSTGTFTFTGVSSAAGYSLTILQSSPGSRTALDGFRDGTLTASGTGPSAPITMNLNITSDHSIDGNLTWEGQSGGMHISNNGTGFVVTAQSRVPIE